MEKSLDEYIADNGLYFAGDRHQRLFGGVGRPHNNFKPWQNNQNQVWRRKLHSVQLEHYANHQKFKEKIARIFNLKEAEDEGVVKDGDTANDDQMDTSEVQQEQQQPPPKPSQEKEKPYVGLKITVTQENKRILKKTE